MARRFRDPWRIERIVALLASYWRRNPDLRLGQIVVNALGVNSPEVFYAEDDEVERGIRAAIASNTSKEGR